MTRPTFLCSPNLQHPRLRHGFFTRLGGVSQGLQDQGTGDLAIGLHSDLPLGEVLENRRRTQQVFGLPFVSARQVHGAEVVTVTAPWVAGAGPTADALVSAKAGLGLGVLTADCVPILLADVGAGVVGACHGGWRGLKAGVVEATVAAMAALGARRPQIKAAIGPCLGPQSYEVGHEFPEHFEGLIPQAATLFKPGASADKVLFDLPAAAKAFLVSAGLPAPTVLDQDTFRHSRLFFSHRRATRAGERDQGRQISLIALNAKGR